MEMGLASTSSPIRRVAPQGLAFEAGGLTPHGSLHRRPVHGLPFPFNPVQLLMAFNGQTENFGKHPGMHPPLEVLVNRTYGTIACG